MAVDRGGFKNMLAATTAGPKDKYDFIFNDDEEPRDDEKQQQTLEDEESFRALHKGDVSTVPSTIKRNKRPNLYDNEGPEEGRKSIV